MSNKSIMPRSQLDARVSLPGSKSLSNRAVLLAAMAEGTSSIRGVLESDDLHVMENALRALGATIEVQNTTWRITGTAGQFHAPSSSGSPLRLDVQASGTAARFLTAAATLADGPVRLDGTARMRQRPIGDLVHTLRALGAVIDIEGFQDCPPIVCYGGGLEGGAAAIDARHSSQYVSALLQVAPYARRPVELHLKDAQLVSRPYVDLTLQVMKDFGVEAHYRDRGTLAVPRARGYRARDYNIEPDASTAAYFFAAAAIAGGRVVVEGLPGDSTQADMGMLALLELMGCTVERAPTHTAVQGPPHGTLAPIDVDMNGMPDAVLAVAVTTLFASGPSHIRNVANLRIKESDRLRALETELRKLGADARADHDALHITPPQAAHGAEIDTYDDHRMAMAFALAGLRVPNVIIRDAECVSKSFPGFFGVFESLQ